MCENELIATQPFVAVVVTIEANLCIATLVFFMVP